MERSNCPACRQALRWYHLIPIVSFVALRGRCAYCAGRISCRYPLVETGVGVLVVALFLRLGPSNELLYVGLFACVMLAVVLTDWQFLLIPNELIVAGVASGIILQSLLYPQTVMNSLLAALLALSSMWCVRQLGNRFIGRESMGMGDVKLAGVVGLFVGYAGFVASVWIASVAALLYVALMGLAGYFSSTGRLRRPSPIPFGAFLAVASSGVLVWKNELETWILRWLLW